MGNRICRKSTVEERFTRPQRLVRNPSNVDYKKLRKLILSQKLAPCFDGVEDSNNNPDLEECPICFFYYPSLNRSRCCMKGICTECFLQMRPYNAMSSAQCPFCKTPSYAVEYRGARTQEEKGLEQAEEQRVIEAKIRMQLRESQNTERLILGNQNSSLEVQPSAIGSRQLCNVASADIDLQCFGGLQDINNTGLSFVGGGIQVVGSPGNAWSGRYDEFDIDLEEIMMMEAIWQSIQDSRLLGGTANQSSGSIGTVGEFYISNQSESSLAVVGQTGVPTSDSVTSAVAVAIASLAEDNTFHSEGPQSIRDNSEVNQGENQNAVVGNQSCMLGTTCCGADSPVNSDKEAEFDDTESENCCLVNRCSMTEDDSQGSISAYPLNVSQCSSEGFISDEDPTAEEANDVESSCLSSLHTISDSSCESTSTSNIGGSPSYLSHSGPTTIERQLRPFSNFCSLSSHTFTLSSDTS
ncbi:PREDICTED: uncharacterized protein LOC104612343 [Nelumbo nucifera]|uniref:RING-type domain-containing protein n=2 Tax=Nelumbo nucifera TaxID=4432 RepID=A0A822Y8R1_NELNU|nr:PREDICTED: uncharacterized protein LOC104612343 [Nelumbo nucifera]DAD27586.1 TPA_asm: hypothetical protein HUJ06_029054 [Nelumbo nucifera]